VSRPGSLRSDWRLGEGKLLDGHAWSERNSKGLPHPTGEKSPNEWGLYDTRGNVQELCQDWYATYYYDVSCVADPCGPIQGERRVTRGGAYGASVMCRASCRSSIPPSARVPEVGFRVVREWMEPDGGNKHSPGADTATGDDKGLPDSSDLTDQPAVAPVPREQVTNSIGIDFTKVPAGESWIGTGRAGITFFSRVAKRQKLGNAFADGIPSEYPRHRVQITKDFFLGTHEVTVGQFARFVQATGYVTEAERGGSGQNWREAGLKQGDDHPVVYVSWNDAKQFCDWLSQQEMPPADRSGMGVCLPGKKSEHFRLRRSFESS